MTVSDITIKVASVHPPKEGAKTGSIKDSTGKFWRFYADKTADFTVGADIRITDYKDSSFNGQTYTFINKYQIVVRGTGGGLADPNFAAKFAQVPSRPVDNNQTRLDIFVCGAFNNALSNVNIHPLELDLVDMINLLGKFKQAWQGTFGPNPMKAADPISSGPPKANGEDMNDAIPY